MLFCVILLVSQQKSGPHKPKLGTGRILHYVTLHYITKAWNRQNITLCYFTLHYQSLEQAEYYIMLCYITSPKLGTGRILHYVMLDYITKAWNRQNITLCYVILHYQRLEQVEYCFIFNKLLDYKPEFSASRCALLTIVSRKQGRVV